LCMPPVSSHDASGCAFSSTGRPARSNAPVPLGAAE
jgi:hypothetical protein